MPDQNQFIFIETLPACAAAFFIFLICTFAFKRKWTVEGGAKTRFANLNFFGLLATLVATGYLLFQHFGPPYEPFRKQNWLLIFAFPSGLLAGLVTTSLSRRKATSFMQLIWVWLGLWCWRFIVCITLPFLLKSAVTTTIQCLIASVTMLLGWWGIIRLSQRISHLWLSLIAIFWFFLVGFAIMLSNDLSTGRVGLSMGMIITSAFVARIIIQYALKKRNVSKVSIENLTESIYAQSQTESIQVDMFFPLGAGLLMVANTHFLSDMTSTSSILLALSPAIATVAYTFWPAGKISASAPGMDHVKKQKTVAALIIFFIFAIASASHTIIKNNSAEENPYATATD